jgi:hypothetical protein
MCENYFCQKKAISVTNDVFACFVNKLFLFLYCDTHVYMFLYVVGCTVYHNYPNTSSKFQMSCLIEYVALIAHKLSVA